MLAMYSTLIGLRCAPPNHDPSGPHAMLSLPRFSTVKFHTLFFLLFIFLSYSSSSSLCNTRQSCYRDRGSRPMWSTVILLAAFSCMPSAAFGQRCYDSRGVQNTNVACDSSASASACCDPTFVCLSNGLCAPGPNTTAAGYQTLTRFYRGSCTDAKWKDSKCPSFCRSNDDSASGQGLNACPGAGPGKYCCWRQAFDCCKNSSSIFDLGIANIQTTIGFTAKASSTSASSSSSTPPPTSSPSMTTGVPASNSTPPSGGSSSKTSAIGAGVGIGILAILVIAAAVFWYRKKMSRHAVVPLNPVAYANSDNYGQPGGYAKAEIDGREVVTPKQGGAQYHPLVEPRYELETTSPTRVHELR
jgi:hypothetical protein